MVLKKLLNLRVLAGALGAAGAVVAVIGAGMQRQWPWRQTVLIAVMVLGAWLLVVINWPKKKQEEIREDYKLLTEGEVMEEKLIPAAEESEKLPEKVEAAPEIGNQYGDPVTELLGVEGKLNEEEKREWIDWLLREQQK